MLFLIMTKLKWFNNVRKENSFDILYGERLIGFLKQFS